MGNTCDWTFPVGQQLRVELNDPSGKFTCHPALAGTFDGTVLHLGFNLEDLPIVQPGTDIVLVTPAAIGEIQEAYYKAKVVDVFFGQALISVSRPAPIEISMLRQYFRCEVCFPVKLMTGSKTLSGTAKNLSAGGIMVEVGVPGRIVCGLRLSCEFTLPGTTSVIAIRGEVVRVQQIEDGLRQVAVRFMIIHEKNRKEILQYQFRRQRELAQKKREQEG